MIFCVKFSFWNLFKWNKRPWKKTQLSQLGYGSKDGLVLLLNQLPVFKNQPQLKRERAHFRPIPHKCQRRERNWNLLWTAISEGKPWRSLICQFHLWSEFLSDTIQPFLFRTDDSVWRVLLFASGYSWILVQHKILNQSGQQKTCTKKFENVAQSWMQR